jgi:hypothetical protein
MTNAKKILITTKSHELFILRRVSRPQHICPICSTWACGVTLDDARQLAGLSAMELIRLIEKGAIYAYEIEAGPLLICRKSLETFCNGEK